MSAPLLELRRITKRFSGTLTLDAVDFDLIPGEVHALLGENGAGKSTLIKILSGIHRPDSGDIVIGGQARAHWDQAAALQSGIATVYQEVNLLPDLSVAENLMLGREPRGPLGIKWREMNEQARQALDRLGLKVDPRQELGTLSIAVRQMVAIARALETNAKVLILDEPTSSLDAGEVETLFTHVRSCRERGLGIIFITHFLDQVDVLADRITILRNGKKTGTWPASALDRRQLVTQMVGRDVDELTGSAVGTVASGSVVGEGVHLTSGSLKGVDVRVSQGEMVGLAGLLGSGRTETLQLFFGLDRPTGGSLTVQGKAARFRSPRQAIRDGIALVPEDRRASAIFPGLSVAENILIVDYARRGWFSPIQVRKDAETVKQWVASLGIKLASPSQPIESLSGGNQQKAILARWLLTSPKLLMLDEPTRGIDIGAKFDILHEVTQLRQQGTGILFASSETAEIVRTCSRVTVLHDRQSVAELSGDELNEDALVHAMAGEAN